MGGRNLFDERIKPSPLSGRIEERVEPLPRREPQRCTRQMIRLRQAFAAEVADRCESVKLTFTGAAARRLDPSAQALGDLLALT